jgi:hypothetical protein
MHINRNDIMKIAASHLRNLSAEVRAYREKEERRECVERIIRNTASDLSGSDFLDKYAEYMEKDLEELKVIEKALELTKTGELNLGELSAQAADNGELDPLTAFLVEDYLQ